MPTPGHTVNTLTPSIPLCANGETTQKEGIRLFFFFKRYTCNFGVATFGIAADTDVFIGC